MLVGMGASFADDAKAPAAPEAAPAPKAEAPAAESAPISPEQMTKSIGYLLGYQTGANISQIGPIQQDDINMESFAQGVKDGMAGQKPLYPEEEVSKAFQEFQKILEQRMEEKAKLNIEASKKFVEENGKKEGVVTTASGLQYKVINKGGDKKYEAPKDGQDMGTRFKVNYKGTLPNGEVFDERNDVEMPLEVIPGFKEALTTMPVGAKWELVIPAELGYGAQGAGGKIGPHQALKFDLELKEILPPDPNQASPQGQSITPEQLQQLMEAASKSQQK